MRWLRTIAWHVILIGVALLMGTAHVQGQNTAAGPKTPSGLAVQRSPVLVELFTSEGCPHCPTADALLARLYSAQDLEGVEIVALEEHVDYWDRREWVDRFSSPLYTQRQQQYVNALAVESMYTPQMVVDGLVEFVGNEESRARTTISTLGRVPKAAVHIRAEPASNAPAGMKTPGAVRISVEMDASAAAQVYLVLAEDKLLSRVNGGSNAGETWAHSSVARWIHLAGAIRPGETSFSASVALDSADPGWRTENLRLIAFVQEEESRRVLAVGTARLAPLSGAQTGPQSGPAAPQTAPASATSN
jgi:hypothetical protein